MRLVALVVRRRPGHAKKLRHHKNERKNTEDQQETSEAERKRTKYFVLLFLL